MGEIAEMMLEGELCEGCGEYLGDGQGFPVRCASCGGGSMEYSGPRARAKGERRKPKPEVPCETCHKVFGSEFAMLQHRKDTHDKPGYKGSEKPPSMRVDGAGEPCPRCGLPTEIKQHSRITAKHLAQPFYYSKWFCCTNDACRTNLIMPERFKVHRVDDEIDDRSFI